MKTTIEINGFEIVISEQDGGVVVSAIKDDETIEEFTLEAEEEVQGSQREIQGTQELQDFPQAQGQAQGQAQYAQEASQMQDEDEVKLESFDTFFNKRK